MKKYKLDVLNLPVDEGSTRTVKATHHDIQAMRMNFYRNSKIIASYPVDKVNIVDVTEIDE